MSAAANAQLKLHGCTHGSAASSSKFQVGSYCQSPLPVAVPVIPWLSDSRERPRYIPKCILLPWHLATVEPLPLACGTRDVP